MIRNSRFEAGWGRIPFSRIKIDLPSLEKLHLQNPWFLDPFDNREILSDNQAVPQLEIKGMTTITP